MFWPYCCPYWSENNHVTCHLCWQEDIVVTVGYDWGSRISLLLQSCTQDTQDEVGQEYCLVWTDALANQSLPWSHGHPAVKCRKDQERKEHICEILGNLECQGCNGKIILPCVKGLGWAAVEYAVAYWCIWCMVAAPELSKVLNPCS